MGVRLGIKRKGDTEMNKKEIIEFMESVSLELFTVSHDDRYLLMQNTVTGATSHYELCDLNKAYFGTDSISKKKIVRLDCVFTHSYPTTKRTYGFNLVA